MSELESGLSIHHHTTTVDQQERTRQIGDRVEGWGWRVGNHQWGGADPRNARSVGTKGAPSLIFFVLSDITSDGDYHPLLHLCLPWFWHHRSPQFRGWEEGTSKTTPDRGTSPPPPLFPAISAPGGGMTLAPSILTQRGELHLPIASKRGRMTLCGVKRNVKKETNLSSPGLRRKWRYSGYSSCSKVGILRL